MKTQFTPGPWHVGMKPGPMVYGPLGEQIVGINVMLDEPEVIANARAISALPDLVAALEYMVKAQSQPFDHADRRASMESARAALAKVKG